MKRFFGMSLTLAILVAALVGLGWAFYWAAAGLGWACNEAAIGLGWNPPGTVSPFAYQVGITIGNVLTLMMVVLMISGSLLTVAERKWSALLQNRIGANRITVAGNPLGGIPYLLADALKMLTKEATGPDQRTRLLFELAPVLSFAPVFCLFAIVPVGPAVSLSAFFGGVGAAGQAVALQVAQLDAGLLYLFAIASLSVYGTSLAGWASNNKLGAAGRRPRLVADDQLRGLAWGSRWWAP